MHIEKKAKVSPLEAMRQQMVKGEEERSNTRRVNEDEPRPILPSDRIVKAFFHFGDHLAESQLKRANSGNSNSNSNSSGNSNGDGNRDEETGRKKNELLEDMDGLLENFCAGKDKDIVLESLSESEMEFVQKYAAAYDLKSIRKGDSTIVILR